MNGESEQCTSTGTTVPDGKNGWTCSLDEMGVVCVRKVNTPNGENNWVCSYTGAAKLCPKKPSAQIDFAQTKLDGSTGLHDAGQPKVDQASTSSDLVEKKPDGIVSTYDFPATNPDLQAVQADSKINKPDTGIPGWTCSKDGAGVSICRKAGEGIPPGGGFHGVH